MRRIRNLCVLALSLAAAACFVSCSNSEEQVDAVAKLANDYSARIQDRLGVSGDDIREMDPSEFPNANAFEGEYYLCTDGDLPSIDCRVYNDAQEAREEFESYYDSFTAAFDEDAFDGDCQSCLENDHGYIVVDGSIPGVDIFGSVYRTGAEVYAGVYYSDNTVVFIMPRNDISNSDVEEVISLLELPMADGSNT